MVTTRGASSVWLIKLLMVLHALIVKVGWFRVTYVFHVMLVKKWLVLEQPVLAVMQDSLATRGPLVSYARQDTKQMTI